MISVCFILPDFWEVCLVAACIVIVDTAVALIKEVQLTSPSSSSALHRAEVVKVTDFPSLPRVIVLFERHDARHLAVIMN